MTHPTLRAVLSQAAARSPDATALFDPERGRSASFAELDRRATAVTDGLVEAGFDPGDHLSVFVRDSVEFVELLFGAAGAGVVFHPISPRVAPDRLAYVIDHAESAGLVFDAFCRERVESLDPGALPERTYAIDDGASTAGDASTAAGYDALAGDPDADPDVAGDVDEDDPALLLYTSGTTGRPKGVRHSHRNVVAGDLAGLPYNRLRPSDVSVAFGPLYHVGPLCCNFMPALHVGATNVLLREFDPGTVLEYVETESITAMWGVPTHFNALVNHAIADRDLSGVRMIQYSGAAMPAAVAESLREHAPGCDLVNAYGTTEIVFGTVLYPEEHDERLGSIGRAVPNAEVRLVDPEASAPDATVPRGETGEILVRTPTRMLEYWRAPEETDAAVVDGWYRTGDLGRRDEDGYVYFVDRKDDMIVSGGENVYPAEVEEVLHGHPDVAGVAVVGVPDEQWGAVVAAVVVPADGDSSAGDLDEFVRESDAIEDFKRPRRYEFRPELPKTQSGKVDRRALVSELDGA